MKRKIQQGSRVSPAGLISVLMMGVCISLIVWTPCEDPINSPKAWLLYIFSSLLLMNLFTNNLFLTFLKTNKTLWTPLAFGVSLILSWSIKGRYLENALGDFGRNTGLLSEISFIVILLGAAFYIRWELIDRVEQILFIFSGTLAIYGLLQHFKMDPIPWVNSLNPIILTLGNPDFAAGILGMLAIIAFGLAFRPGQKSYMRLAGILLFAILLADSFWSGARQGVLEALIGLAVLSLGLSYFRSRKLFLIYLCGLMPTAALTLAGMLNQGPLAKYLYKASIAYRGDYWRAGIAMFRHNIFFGVGLGSFGSFFTQYRDLKQVHHRGPTITSSAAHNVFINLAATGGILVVLIYTLFVIVLSIAVVRSLKKFINRDRYVVLVLFGAWVGYLFDSFISVENIGQTIWFWILSGLLIGLICEKPQKISTALKSKNFLRYRAISSLGFAIYFVFVTVLCSSQFLSSIETHALRSYPTSPNGNTGQLLNIARSPIQKSFVDEHTRIVSGQYLVQWGATLEGVNILKGVVSANSHSFDGLLNLARISEYFGKYQDAIKYRLKMEGINPLDYESLKSLKDDALKVGNLSLGTRVNADILKVGS